MSNHIEIGGNEYIAKGDYSEWHNCGVCGAENPTYKRKDTTTGHKMSWYWCSDCVPEKTKQRLNNE